jgi:hypothetical protein
MGVAAGHRPGRERGQNEGARYEASVLPRQFGRIHRDRHAERRVSSGSGIPARFFVIAMMVLAAIMVLASLIH